MHNGNKRTALVSLLCHLDKNNYTFTDKADQHNLYSFMLNIAAHTIVPKKKLKRRYNQSDLEVEAMTKWIAKKTRKIEKSERVLSFMELEKILKQHDIYFENQKNNHVDVVKYTTITTGWFKKKAVRVGKKVANIPYWSNRTVGKKLIRSIREKAGLTHKEGIDSFLFYSSNNTPDYYIQKYKKTLRSLAKT